MNPMKKIAAVSALSAILLFPGISQASAMQSMDAGMMTGQNGTMSSKDMMNGKDMMSSNMDMTNYVPLRMFAETLGYKLMWNSEDQSITLTYMGLDTGMGMDMDSDMEMDKSDMSDMTGMYTVTLMAGSKEIMVGMDKKMLDQAPIMIDGKTCVPKAFITMYLLAPFMMKAM